MQKGKINPKGHSAIVDGSCVDIGLLIRTFFLPKLTNNFQKTTWMTTATVPPRQAWFMAFVILPALDTASRRKKTCCKFGIAFSSDWVSLRRSPGRPLGGGILFMARPYARSGFGFLIPFCLASSRTILSSYPIWAYALGRNVRQNSWSAV